MCLAYAAICCALAALCVMAHHDPLPGLRLQKAWTKSAQHSDELQSYIKAAEKVKKPRLGLSLDSRIERKGPYACPAHC